MGGISFGNPYTDNRLRNLYFNTPMPPSATYWRARSQGSISAPRPTMTQRVENAISEKLNPWLGKRMAGKVAGVVTGATPVGAVTQGFDSGAQIRGGNYLGGGAGAVLAAMPGIPKGGRFGGELREMLPLNDTGDGLDTIKSLVDFLSDPRPLHQMYEVGDVLSHKGEVGHVIHATDDAVVLKLPSGQRIVPRRDPHLTVAPYDRW